MAMRRAHRGTDGQATVARHPRGARPLTQRRPIRRGTAVDAAHYGTVRHLKSARLRRDRSTSCGEASRTAAARRRRSVLSVYAVAIAFAIHGMISGSFATRVPWFAGRLDLDAGQLGIALLCPALGAALVIPLAGKVVGRFGGRLTSRVAITIYCVWLAVPAFMPDISSLCASLLVFGVLSGVCDVAIKALGNAMEYEMDRSIMSRLFGIWSLGTLVGAGIGTAATFAHLDARLHLTWIAVAVLVLAGLTGAALPRTSTAPATGNSPAAPRPRRIVLPSRALMSVALIGFCAAFGESAAHTWASVYISQVTGGSAATASFGFVAFVASMAVGRFAGDALVQRFGPVRTVQYAGALGAGGAGLVMVAGSPLVGLIGFAMLGLGVAVIVPVTLRAGARVADTPSQGITAVLVAAQLACTTSPAALGRVADSVSLPAAFGVTLAIIVPVVATAGVLRAPQPATAPATATSAPLPLAIDAAPALVPATEAWNAAIGSVPMATVMTNERYVDDNESINDLTREIPAMERDISDEHLITEMPVLANA